MNILHVMEESWNCKTSAILSNTQYQSDSPLSPGSPVLPVTPDSPISPVSPDSTVSAD